LLDNLKIIPSLNSLSEPHLERVINLATEHHWPAGQTIFREGERDGQLYIVLEGRVALELHVPTRGRVTILTVGPGEMFGWSAAVAGLQKKTAGARTAQATWAVGLDSAALAAACEADHDLGFHVYRWLANVIAGRLTATRLQLLDMYAVD
jgi:CRP-like cAMP-binding protein